VQVVVGPPGTGKTFALDAAREAWEASGYTVVGAAVARRAARRVEVSAGIRSTSVAALQRELRIGGEYGLGPNTVVVVDEAGMLGTRDLHEIVEHASGAGARVVLVGDHKQLPEIDAGGTFRALAIRTDPIMLTENRRQRDEWARRMVKLIRDGDVREGLDLASDRGAIVVAATAQAAQAQLVREWWRATEGGADTMMIAYRRAEVRDLNAAARALMDDAGRLGRERLELPAGEFAAGDHVLLKRGSKTLDVDNGDAGVVDHVDAAQGRLIVRVGEAGDRVVTLPHEYLHAEGVGDQASLVHGYASTGHVHQGATADQTFALGSPGLYQEWITTAASRPRDQLRFYLADPDCERHLDFHAGDQSLPDAFEAFVLQAERSQAQAASVDTIHREDLASMPADQLRAEIDRLEGIVRQAPGPRLKRQLANAEADLADAERIAHQATARRRDVERTLDERDRHGNDVQAELTRVHAIEVDAHAGVGEAAERLHEVRVALSADRLPETHADDLARYAAAR
jgi:ATP-dependent exoDNAse (exonuclease V) alpha subunit